LHLGHRDLRDHVDVTGSAESDLHHPPGSRVVTRPAVVPYEELDELSEELDELDDELSDEPDEELSDEDPELSPDHPPSDEPCHP